MKLAFLAKISFLLFKNDYWAIPESSFIPSIQHEGNGNHSDVVPALPVAAFPMLEVGKDFFQSHKNGDAADGQQGRDVAQCLNDVLMVRFLKKNEKILSVGHLVRRGAEALCQLGERQFRAEVDFTAGLRLSRRAGDQAGIMDWQFCQFSQIFRREFAETQY